MDSQNSERKPLLESNGDEANNEPHDAVRNGNEIIVPEPEARNGRLYSETSGSGLESEITHSSAGSVVVKCRVCKAVIDISNSGSNYVVKCGNCGEATPIRQAPQGRKYVRCTCKCLLIHKATSRTVCCPRPNCKRVLEVAAPLPSVPGSISGIPGMCSVNCAHCHDSFYFNILKKSLARCPHCRRRSSVGPVFARIRSVFYLACCLLAIGVTVGFVLITKNYHGLGAGWLFFVYLVMFALIVFLLFTSLYYCMMKVSHIERSV